MSTTAKGQSGKTKTARPAATASPAANGTLHPLHSLSGPIGPSALVRLRAALGWSRVQMGQVINCSDRALVNWEQGEPISAVYAAKLRELQSLFEELNALMKPGDVGRWLTAENEEFGHQSPADLIRRGETGRLWQSFFYLRSGQPD